MASGLSSSASVISAGTSQYHLKSVLSNKTASIQGPGGTVTSTACK